MASIKELVELFNSGAMGKLLASTFNGERGRVCPNEDSDVLVVFRSEAETPDIIRIKKVITDHYTKLGYRVEPNKLQSGNCFEAFVYWSSKEHGIIGIVVTTNYPFPAPGQGTASLRLTSTIMVY